MKKSFPGYYTPSDKDFIKMWEEGLFIFDTNVLLDLYRYSDETVINLLDTIEKIKDRIWIPYRVAFEYHRRLNDIIKEQAISYTGAIKTLKDFNESFKKKKGHPFLKNELQVEIENFCKKLYDELGEKEKVIKDLFLDNPIKEKLSNLIETRIGNAFDSKELNEIYLEGEKRYGEKIPPGYKDKGNKVGNEIYGDLIIWKEILKKAKESDSPIVFVTGDVKEDWFQEIMGITIGPRAELIQEIKDVNDILFHIYSTDSFLRYAKNLPKYEIKETTLIEIEEMIEEAKMESKRIREVEYEMFIGFENDLDLDQQTESDFLSDQQIGDSSNEENQSAI